MKKYYVYIMTNKYNTILYTGVTNNLIKRVFEHKEKTIEGFTKKYNCNKLVWFEEALNIKSAIAKEKQIKKWKKDYKINLINSMNPDWKDLYNFIV
ncbi:MAG TPA: GIY-YIG nuclease family protein [Spirochaetota bacterium]|nr:GIY-YIG nuclease family protein [Spirochaetota bacterium]HPI89041.1 GIY-YIG nuclease family protein [Spirochaetota bacterium]HPR48666.1 GIY-YIG nuclease family protein [Spirochaetota bacterium]